MKQTIIITFMLLGLSATSQTVTKGDLILPQDRYFVEIYDYEDGRWQWVNIPYFDYGKFNFYVDKFDRLDWRVITCTCTDTTYYSIYGAPKRTKIDTAVAVDGGHHTIGNNPNPILE